MRASRIVPVFGPPVLLAGLLAGCGAPVQDAAEVASTAAPADAPLYFPPADGPWATVDPGDVGWDAAKLEAALDVAAQGALDKKLYVVPSLDLVVTRLGDRGSIEGSSFNDAFWDLLIQAAPPQRNPE